MNDSAYVLVSAGKNEEAFIEQTLRSVVNQTVLPRRWVIVDDGSTDRTAEIVRRYATQHSFITLLSLPASPRRSFGAQYRALERGLQLLPNDDYGFIGFLDTDIGLPDVNFYRKLLREFVANPRLGLAGGCIQEQVDGIFQSRVANREWSVAGATQIFRRECFEKIGGYIPLEYGGSDSLAEIMVKMEGWEIRSFLEIPVLHYRPTSSAGGKWKGLFHLGMMDAALGSYWAFELVKCANRFRYKPYFLGAFVMFCGYLWFHLKSRQQSIPREAVLYLKREQKQRLVALLYLRGNSGVATTR